MEVKFRKFIESIAKLLYPLPVQLVESKKMVVTHCENKEITLRSLDSINDHFYEIIISNHILINKISRYNETDYEVIFKGILLRSEDWDTIKSPRDYDLLIDYQFDLIAIDEMKLFFKHMDIQIFDQFYHFIDDELNNYKTIVKDDLEFMFNLSDGFNKSLEVYGDYFCKHNFGDVKTITYSSGSAVQERFTIYYHHTKTNEYRIYHNLVSNLDPTVFKINTTIIGRYKKIIDHQINHTEPCVIVQNGVVVRNNHMQVMSELVYNKESLAKKLKQPLRYAYDKSNLNSVLQYFDFDNINLLYTTVIWTGDSPWVKGDDGYYIDFKQSALINVPRNTPMVSNDEVLGWISYFQKSSTMLNLPDGHIAPEWKTLIANAYWHVFFNHDKMSVCSLTIDTDTTKESILEKVAIHLEKHGVI